MKIWYIKPRYNWHGTWPRISADYNVIIDAVGGISYCSWNWWIRWNAIINRQFLYMTSCVLNVLHFNNTLMNVLTANKPYFAQIDAVSYIWPIRYPVSHVNNIYVVFFQFCFIIGKVIFFVVQLFYINYVAYIFV